MPSQPDTPGVRPDTLHAVTPGPLFIFAGGGTGGHLYPALSVWESLHELRPDCRALFLCSDRAIDERILRAEGVAWEALRAKPFGLGPRSGLRFLRGWHPSVGRAKRLLSERPAGAVHVVAMGGFVAAPVVQAARRASVPITMVNLDAVPGKANNWITRQTDTIISTADVPGRPSWSFVPPIVRSRARVTESASKCRFGLGLHPDRRTLMISGGSQGARSINALMIAIAGGAGHPNLLAGWQVLHQTGESDEQAVRRAYEKAGVASRVEAFVPDLGVWWGAATLAIGRAGAGTVGEVWANHVPAVFMPYPYHADDHQRINARPLVDAGGAILTTDLIDPTDNARTIGPVLRDLLQRDDRREGMRAALEALGPADGADRIADRLAKAMAHAAQP